MQISAKELRQMASDVDDMHHDAMRDFKEEAAELHLDADPSVPAAAFLQRGRPRRRRRRAAHRRRRPRARSPASAASPRPRASPTPSIAGYAQSVELAAVAAYTAAAPALTGDTLAVAQLFLGHHQEHADAFGAVAGDDARPEANPKLVAAVTPTLEAVDGRGRRPARTLTDRRARVRPRRSRTRRPTPTPPPSPLLQDPAYAAATSTILPIEAQHATVLAVALGKGPDDLFPTGAFESAALGDGTDPKAGLDPAVFA